jgi:hypothetical protein
MNGVQERDVCAMYRSRTGRDVTEVGHIRTSLGSRSESKSTKAQKQRKSENYTKIRVTNNRVDN